MKAYEVTIKEIRKCTVIVEAENVEEAEKKIDRDYYKDILEYDSILEPYDTEFEFKEM